MSVGGAEGGEQVPGRGVVHTDCAIVGESAGDGVK